MLKKDFISTSRKRIRRKYLVERAIRLFLILVAAAAITVGIFYIPYFRVKNISVEGTQYLNREDILLIIRSYLSGKYLGLVPRDSLLYPSAKELAKLIVEEFPRIQRADIARDLPAAVTVRIKERQTWGIACYNDAACFQISRDGVIFGKTLKTSGTVLFGIEDRRGIDYELGAKMLPEEEMARVIFLEEKLQDLTKRNFSRLTISADNVLTYYELFHEDGWFVIFDSLTDPQQALENFTAIFRETFNADLSGIEYIDIRFKNKAFYLPR